MATRAKEAQEQARINAGRTATARAAPLRHGSTQRASKAARFGGKRAASPPVGGQGNRAPPSKDGKAQQLRQQYADAISARNDAQTIPRKTRSSSHRDGRVRPTSPTYSESAFHVPYSQRATTAPDDANRAMRRDVAKIWAVIDDQRCAPLAAAQKREELLLAFLMEPEVRALRAKAMQDMAESHIANGVRETLDEMRTSSKHKSSLGRVVYRGIMHAALRGFAHVPETEKRRLYGFLGVSQQAVSDLVQTLGSTVQLDAGRATRSDALDDVERDKALRAWECLTRPSPNMKDVVRMRVGVKEYITHGAHYLE